MKTVEELRQEVKRLDERMNESRTLYKELQEVRNALALATADFFVTVDNGSVIGVFGASRECISKAFHLRITTDGMIVNIQKYFNEGSVILYLEVGGQIAFDLVDDEDDEARTIHFVVRTFSNKPDAYAWAASKIAERISR
ncbi:MAG: hypothetical protein UU48_C0006G0150 [Candidatus Uhrbacteria bacterium GW2011_GWF2_41_16]|jgi:hypothetical protein|uniref:Uncharacterized protein n=1 Tax=Candidatus Uhrbacteria bacterium GW2011_GWF2_41_16 TaxID=1618997 RepID=A0A0G0XMV9_9BACT|nr:MAG: hypothetical protein UU31_C0002G0008 [Candidatus Uhrbacteria bacterium GW2011_GWA2_41_10]KKR98110.1 MAG: hypothetical protein UU48_C0006G0150 [Candidatus Uhrbacteria bacterium GW2011_GWF2_41_16]